MNKQTYKHVDNPKFVRVADIEVGKIYKMYSYWWQYVGDITEIYGYRDITETCGYRSPYKKLDLNVHGYVIDTSDYRCTVERWKILGYDYDYVGDNNCAPNCWYISNVIMLNLDYDDDDDGILHGDHCPVDVDGLFNCIHTLRPYTFDDNVLGMGTGQHPFVFEEEFEKWKDANGKHILFDCDCYCDD
jgi:hypothetical protein